MSRATEKIYRRIRSSLLRWELAAIGFAMAVITLVAFLSNWRFSRLESQRVVYASLALLVAILAASWVIRWSQLKRRLADTELNLDRTQARMTAAFRLSHLFARAKDEQAVIEQVLESCLEVVGVKGASFVALDTHAQPHPAIFRGDPPVDVMKDWGEWVASPHTREACASCKDHAAAGGASCPLLAGPLEREFGVHCFPVRRGNIDFGMLNLYLQVGGALEPEALAFLSAMLDEMAMAIEAVRLRVRAEHTAFELREFMKPELENVLPVLLQGMLQVLGADWAYLSLYKNHHSPQQASMIAGNAPELERGIFEGLLKPLNGSRVPLVRNAADSQASFPDGVETLVISPLNLPDGEIVGGLVLGFGLPHSLPEYICILTQAISAQLAVAAHYAQQVRLVEYQAVIGERTRLAREIHDGLAQTLGFLKLMATQMKGYLERGEEDRLAGAVEMCRQALAEAYLDTREAIDGLRISPEQPLEDWLVQAGEEFSINNDLPVKIKSLVGPQALPAEIQAQLMRIVQEALTNIRKHAQASEVTIGCMLDEGQMILEIQDDGLGFDMRDVLGPARHGLKGMRERADLIEAELEFMSQPGQGTLIRLRLPLLTEEALA